MSQLPHQGSATIQPPLLQCNFARPGCPHAEEAPLFGEQYKRTNRTRATKIVRCFPHCCPEHRPRSYCGTSLHVEITTAANAEPELHVFGRFEEHEQRNSDGEVIASSGLALDAHVLAKDIREASAGAPIWVKGEIDTMGATPTQVIYALRGSDDGFNHWEYDWKSGTSQRQRLTQHHFRVYVFMEHSPEEWTVVGMVTSPPFTFSVYRKPQHDPERTPIQDQSRETTSLEGVTVTPSTTTSDEEDEEEDDGVGEDDIITQTPAASLAVLRELVWHHQNRSVGKITTNLAILTILACEGDPTWLTMRPRLIIDLLRDITSASHSSSAMSDQLLPNYVNHCVPQLIALLPHHTDEGTSTHGPQVLGTQATPSDASLSKWQAAMELFTELLCFLLQPAQSTPLLAFASAHASLPLLSSERRREVFVQILEMFAERVEHFLQTRNQSTESLVDDVVSIVLAKKHGPTYHRTLFLLRNVKVMGQSWFNTMLQRLQADMQTDGHSVGSLPSDSEASRWTGRWICRGFKRAALAEETQRRRSWPDISRPSAASARAGTWSVSLMTSMNLILTAFGLTITRTPVDDSSVEDGVHDAVGIYPIASPSGKSGGVFPLDYTFRHATNMLPLEWMAVFICGDHHKDVFCRARALGDEGDDSQVEVAFLAYTSGQEHASPWRCVLRFELLSSRANEEATTMHPLVAPRRRMHVHVQVDQGQSCSIQRRANTEPESVSEDDETKSTGSSHSGSSTESENCERRGRHAKASTTLDSVLQVYTDVENWLRRLKFMCIYYSIE